VAIALTNDSAIVNSDREQVEDVAQPETADGGTAGGPVDVLARRNGEVQHEQRDGDGEDPVAERLDPPAARRGRGRVRSWVLLL
jgi:hypothetical protein